MRIPGARRRASDGRGAPSPIRGLRRSERLATAAMVSGLVVVSVAFANVGGVPESAKGPGDSAQPSGAGSILPRESEAGGAGFLESGAASGSPDASGAEASAAPSGVDQSVRPTATSTPHATPGATAKPTPTLPPVNGTFALGMWTGQPWEPSNLDAGISLIGRTPAILMTYQHWDRQPQFLAADAQVIKSRGASWMVTWEPDASLQSIARGDNDAFITSWAKAADAWGGTIYLRYMHEMNGDWYPWGVYNGHNGNSAADFVAAWRHTHDLFVAAGATNVKWVWSPNVRYPNGEYPFANLYPGSAYVDWVALDGYNWGGQVGGHPGWQSFTTIFQASYNAVLAYGKPIAVAETASAEAGGDKAAWIRQSFFTDIPQKMPAIRAVIWFNQSAETDFRVNSSAATLAAFKQVAAAKAWKGRIP